jgi:hypothetical protein
VQTSNNQYIASVASVDTNNVESLFSDEKMISVIGSAGGVTAEERPIELLQNRPNPYDESTTISVRINSLMKAKDAYIAIKDEAGNEVQRLPVSLRPGINEVEFGHGYHAAGTYLYTLVIDGKPYETRKMVFSN